MFNIFFYNIQVSKYCTFFILNFPNWPNFSDSEEATPVAGIHEKILRNSNKSFYPFTFAFHLLWLVLGWLASFPLSTKYHGALWSLSSRRYVRSAPSFVYLDLVIISTERLHDWLVRKGELLTFVLFLNLRVDS